MPFCFHKCHYCDFYSLVDTRDRQEAFVDRLIRELSALAPLASQSTPLAGRRLDSIFVGGGTPSLLRVNLWERLLAALHERFDLSGMARTGPGEFTVECNPETVTPELLATLAAGGVNRISLGAQSFQPRLLKALERWHDPENVRRAIALAREADIPRQSVDLIYAIPGQTLADWEGDVAAAIGLGTTHISAYNLTYEPNTAMTARKNRGEFAPTDEDVEVEMFMLAAAKLRDAGLRRYEVSNYARPGDEARHNLAYWRQDQWLAAGPSASAHVRGMRWKNTPRLDDYLTIDDEGFAPIVDFEPRDDARLLRERIMTGLRLSGGVDTAAILADARSFDEAWAERLASRAKRWIDTGHLIVDSGRWRLSDAGMLLADGIAGELMACCATRR